ncbi:MAG: PEP-CTERM sorting domain-containing protein [Opitutales bacterium]
MKNIILTSAVALGLSTSSASAQGLFASVSTLDELDAGAPVVEAALTSGILNPNGQDFVATADTFAGVTLRFTNRFQGPTDTFNVTLTLFSEAGLNGSVLGTATVSSDPFGVDDTLGNQVEATQDIEILLATPVATTIGDTLSFSFGTDADAGYLRTSNDELPGVTLLFSNGNAFGTRGVDAGFSVLSEVPEPSTYALIGGLMALGIAVVRRRLVK